MFEKVKEFYKNHEYGVQIGGTVVGYVGGEGHGEGDRARHRQQRAWEEVETGPRGA